jgi:uncharacterized protein YbjT (DUF2867 family)
MSSSKIIAVIGATGAQGGGLARAIAANPASGFTARAITRNPDSHKAKALAALGVEVVQGDADHPASLERAFAGAYGAFCVTNYWEHLSAEREGVQAANMARATKKAGLEHVIWSTLEDTREWIPLDDPRMPALQGLYNVPHFDSKGQVDVVFEEEAAPTSYLHAAFYWENFIYFGMGPRAGADGALILALPLGGAKLPGIGAEDLGGCAFGIFQQGPEVADERFGVAGEVLSGEDMASQMSASLGREIKFIDVPFDAYRALGFPGAEDLGNMFQVQQILGDDFINARSPGIARDLNPDTQSFEAWLSTHRDALTGAIQ